MEYVLVLVVVLLLLALVVGVIRRIKALLPKKPRRAERPRSIFAKSPRFGTPKYYLGRLLRGVWWLVRLPFRVLWGILRLPLRFIRWSWKNRPGKAYRDRTKRVYTQGDLNKAVANTAFIVFAAGMDGWELLPPEVMGRNRIIIQKGPDMFELKNGDWKQFKARRVGFDRNMPIANGNVTQTAKVTGIHWSETEEGKEAVKKALLKYRNDLVPTITDEKDAMTAMWNLVRGRMWEGQNEPIDRMHEYEGNQGQAIERIHKVLKNDIMIRKQQKPLF